MPAPNRTRYAVLGFLTQQPMSGYDIKKAVERSIDNFWSESFGQIYPILKRLSEEGLVEKEAAAENGKRPRHVYSITEKGREELRGWLREPTAAPQLRVELLLKLFFGGQADAQTNRRQIEAYRERVASDLDRYRSIATWLKSEQADHADLPFWLITLRYGEREREALLGWCDEALSALDRIPDAAYASTGADV